MGSAPQLRWTSAACSDVGLVREINEDACLDRPARGLWAVADGMGGHARGDVASRMVVEALDRLASPGDLPGFVVAAQQRLQEVNRQLRREAACRAVRLIGSTVVVLLAGDRECGYLWAGDSRLYLYRGGRLQQLTRDHSQIEAFKSLGDPVPASASPNLITRAVGAVDTLDLDQGTLKVSDGDMFLLCSDGLSNVVGEHDMRGALASGNCRQAAETLVESALQRGGRDNISALVVLAEDLCDTDKTTLNPAL